MPESQYLGLVVYWSGTLMEIRSVYLEGRRMEQLTNANIQDLGKYLYELKEQGWETIEWDASADGAREGYLFKRGAVNKRNSSVHTNCDGFAWISWRPAGKQAYSDNWHGVKTLKVVPVQGPMS